MNNKYIFLKPTFFNALWGDGSILKKYNVDKYIPEETDRNTIAGLGAFSGLSSDANEILNGDYKGKKLNELYDEHPEFFRTYKFPLNIHINF